MRRIEGIPFIDTHTAGEPTRIVLGGFPKPQGETMAERRRWLDEHADGLRRLVLQEPRGHRDMFGALITDPIDPTCDVGVFFMQSAGFLSMCGHGTIGVVTALVASGRCTGPNVTLDTPAGRVACRVCGNAASPSAVVVRNVASFYLGEVDVDGIRVALAYGGNLFGLVDVESIGRHVDRPEITPLVELGLRLRADLNRRSSWTHPADERSLPVELIEFYEDGDPPRNLVVFGHGQVDRSPCGTGTSAKMALLHARGELQIGQPYPYRSVLDTEFVGRIAEETEIAGCPAIIPEIEGTAFVTATGELVLGEGDPFPEGFTLLDDGP